MDTIEIIPPEKAKVKEGNEMKAKTVISRVLFVVGLLVVGSGILESVVLRILERLGW